MNHKSTLWLFPLSFLIHDGEEILTMPAWFANNRAVLDRVTDLGVIPSRIVANLALTTAEVAAAVAFELAFILGATLLLARSPQRGFGLYFYAALLGAYALHVLTHLGQVLVFGGYTPVCVYLYWRLFGAVLLPPVVVLAHFIGRSLA